MPTPAQQKAFFEENGYLIVEDILNAEQLEELRRRVDIALEGKEPQFGDFEIQWEPYARERPDLPRAQKIRVMFHLCHRDPFFWSHAVRPEILDIVELLIGPDIKIYTDQMFVKAPLQGTAVPYHQDSAYWPVEPPNLVSCWMALDDATVENGCVRVIPGSHKALLPHHHYPESIQSLGLEDDEVDADREIPVELKAGSCMFHHSLLAHRSAPNRSPHYRKGLVTIYLPSTLRFTQPWDFKYGFKLLRGKEYPGSV
ncbi:MAG: phytanoyl-CoA dioxygenase family protein [Armatimonadetes bacterium]|nr:phytanoyl-CoA dioxygenase family protein [Armatimonadota bacterium]